MHFIWLENPQPEDKSGIQEPHGELQNYPGVAKKFQLVDLLESRMRSQRTGDETSYQGF